MKYGSVEARKGAMFGQRDGTRYLGQAQMVRRHLDPKSATQSAQQKVTLGILLRNGGVSVHTKHVN